MVVKVAAADVAEVGYWTAAEARGQGVAVRALGTASSWAHATRHFARLELLHARGNRASCRVAEKCGCPLHDLLPAAPPAFPNDAHRHVRYVGGSAADGEPPTPGQACGQVSR